MNTGTSLRRRFAVAMIATSAAAVFAVVGELRTAAAAGAYAVCSDQCCDDACCADGCCADTCCADGCCGTCQKCCCSPPWAHCSSIWGDFLYLHPTGADVAHAQQQNGTGGAGTVPFGLIGVANPDYEPGFRVGGNIALSQCSSIALAYTFFESDTASGLAAPIIPGGGGAIGSLVQHPGAGIISSAGPVRADYEIDFQLADIELRRLLFGDNRGWMNYSVGARYAHLEQEFFQNGVFGGSQAGVITTDSSSEFDGGGAMFGLDGERLVGCGGLSVYGNVGVSPVVGQVTTEYVQNNATTAVLLANSRWKDDRFITILDFELGVSYTGKRGLWKVSAGYLAQFWYNTVTTPQHINAVQANNYVDVGDTLSFDGFVTRIERKF